MKAAHRLLLVAQLLMISVILAACAGTKVTSPFNGSGGAGAPPGPGTYTIGGTVAGLTGTGLVIADNGTDTLTITANGSFTFKTAVSGAYSVTIQTQPTNPAQTCGVLNGTGTATANVTNVEVACQPAYTIGGTISGLLGSGMVLQDNGGDNLTVTGTGTVNFTFPTALLSGATYAVTIKTQPSNPTQTCTLVNATGTVSGSVTTVQITCSQPKFSISGVVTGLVVGAGDTIELQDNAGDNIFVTGDTPFTFPTLFTYGTTYSVNVFLPPTSQVQGCTVFFATAVVTADVSDVIVDCQHNDWAWMFPATPASINQYGTATLAAWVEGTPLPAPPFSTSNSNTPGGRDFAMAWTDNQGRRWLFGGYGFEVTHPSTDGIPGFLNDMWVWPAEYGWWLPGGWVPANLPIVFNAQALSYSADTTNLQLKDRSGIYGTLGSGTSCKSGPACTTPGARWGGATWTDAAGNLWMFGGQGLDSTGSEVLLNDIWEFDITSGPCSYDLTTGTGIFTNCEWIWQGGKNVGNQPTTGTFPGGRWAIANFTDSSGNVWMFGGQGYDSAGNVGLLNDLWKYNIGTGVWTLVSGSTLANQDGVYGTQGTGAAGNVPGGRQAGVLWVDSSGNVWLFGGFGLDSAGTSGGTGQIGSVLNDLWEYKQGTGQWTWVSGANLANQNGVYTAQATSNANLNASATNMPGSRWGALGWIDSSNNLWLFGGFGYGSVATHPTGFLNDVWEYDSALGQWIWWKGSTDVDQPGTYITTPFNAFQINYTNNAVGARRGAAFWLPDPLGYVYVFGGEGYAASGGPYGDLNDLWRYLPFP